MSHKTSFLRHLPHFVLWFLSVWKVQGYLKEKNILVLLRTVSQRYWLVKPSHPSWFSACFCCWWADACPQLYSWSPCFLLAVPILASCWGCDGHSLVTQRIGVSFQPTDSLNNKFFLCRNSFSVAYIIRNKYNTLFCFILTLGFIM